MGLLRERAKSSIRFSLGQAKYEEDVEFALALSHGNGRASAGVVAGAPPSSELRAASFEQPTGSLIVASYS